MVYLAKRTRSQGRRRVVDCACSCRYRLRTNGECVSKTPKSIPQGLKPISILQYLRHD